MGAVVKVQCVKTWIWINLVSFLSVLDVSPTLPLDATTTTTIAAAFSIQGIFFGGDGGSWGDLLLSFPWGEVKKSPQYWMKYTGIYGIIFFGT